MRRMVIGIIIAVVVLALLYPLMLALIAFNSPPPPTVGIEQLTLCPETPNCVSSLAGEREAAQVPRLSYTGEQFIARAFLVEALEAQPGTQILVAQDDYIHAERRTRVMRFVDDIELKFDDEAKEVEVRVAARLGYSDGGNNRRFVESLRQTFDQLRQ